MHPHPVLDGRAGFVFTLPKFVGVPLRALAPSVLACAACNLILCHANWRQARVLQRYLEVRFVTVLGLNYDFALITLLAPAPEGTTHLDLAAGEGTVRYDLTTAGYPADKPGQNKMWTVRPSAVGWGAPHPHSPYQGGFMCEGTALHMNAGGQAIGGRAPAALIRQSVQLVPVEPDDLAAC